MKLNLLLVKFLENFYQIKYNLIQKKKVDNYQKEFKKIALILTSPLGYGDLVMMLPVIKAFRKNFPKSKIDLITNLDIFDEIEGIDNICIIKGNKLQIITEFRKLSKTNYDLGVVLARAVNQSIYLDFLNPKYKLGYLSGYKINSNFKLYPENLSFEKEKHFTLNSLNILKSMNLKYNSTFPKINYTKKTILESKEIFNDLNLDKTKKNIFINPYVLWETRRWDEKNYISLIVKLHKKFNFVLYGGPDGKQLAQDIEQELSKKGIKIFTVVGKIKLKPSIYFLKYSDLFITSDSGPMHFAIMMKVKTIAFFGPVKPQQRLPLYKNDNYMGFWYGTYAKYSSYDYESEHKDINMQGLRAIPVSDVEKQIAKFFKL